MVMSQGEVEMVFIDSTICMVFAHTHNSDMVSRCEVLRLYRQILQVARSWQAAVELDTSTERTYIREEARRLFRKNRNVS